MSELFDRLQAGLPERYTLDRKIGDGGMSTVFLAREHHPNRLVAIKVLDPALGARVGQERFLLEVDVASNLTHPHIVPIFAAGEADGLLYYVMPYIAQETLQERIQREVQLPLEDAVRIGMEIAKALAHAHERDVVHRDIKPANILFQDDGHVVVADFGIARAISAARGTTLTAEGTALGTPAYMAPEQITSEGVIDGRADIYALGCVLYEMLTGAPPFTGRTARVVLARHLSDPIPSIRTARDTVPETLEAVVQRALAKVPSDRYPTARALGEGLSESLHDVAMRWSTPDTIRVQRAPPARRWRSALLAAPVLALAILIGRLTSGGNSNPAPIAAAPIYIDSIAVFPVANLSGDSLYGHVGSGITDNIIQQLSLTPNLKVISRYSAEAAQGYGVLLPVLADTLGVRLLLESSINIRDSDAVVNARLVDATRDAPVWAHEFTTSLENAMLAERDLAIAIVDRIVGSIDGLAAASRAAANAESPGHDETLLGRERLLQRTPDGISESIAHFRNAIRLDPTYAPAYAGLASAYTLAAIYRYQIGLGGYEMAGFALSAADRAIALDSTLGGGYAARGLLRRVFLAPADSADADFAAALRLNPNNPNGPSWSAPSLVRQGRIDAAFSEAERAIRLDPFSAGRRVALAMLALSQNRPEQALKEARRALDIEPNLAWARSIEGRALLLAGRAGECANLTFGPGDGVRAACLYEAGRHEEGAAIVDSLIGLFASGDLGDSTYNEVTRLEDLAAYYAWVGQVDSTITWMTRALERAPDGMESRLVASPLFDRVRSDPAFQTGLETLRGRAWPRVVRASQNAPI